MTSDHDDPHPWPAGWGFLLVQNHHQTVNQVFDDITLVSFVPGRLRLKLGRVEPSVSLVADLHERIATLPGIDQVEINLTTRSILVKYDQNLFASDRSVVALQQALDRQLSTEERMQLRSLLQSQNSGEALRALAKQLSPREIERIQAMLHHLAS
jgi:hypothetical protein